MRITIEIDTDNDSWAEGCTRIVEAQELGSLVADLAYESLYPEQWDDGQATVTIRDLNGNTVGTAKATA